MSQDQMSNIVKCGTHSNVFTWDIELHKRTFSNVFQFCGYCCYFVFRWISSCQIKGHYDVTITLHGYGAPHKKQISCHYSSIVIYVLNSGIPSSTAKIGEIHTVEETICIDVFQGITPVYNYRTLCFSWSENGDSDVLSQGVQTEPASSTNLLEQWTQTEETQISPVRDNSTETEISIHVLEQWTQTEKTQISSLNENCTESGTESCKFLEILSKELGCFYEGQTDHDCVLIVGETKFNVHRSVLAARSPVFAAMFHHDTSENRNGAVDIPDVDAAALGKILYYIYAGKIRGLSPDTAVSMYVVADKYSLIDLRDKCVDFLICNLTMENVCDATLLAHTHAEMKLENKIVEFIEERLDELCKNEKWKVFSDTHAKLANKFLLSAFISSKKK